MKISALIKILVFIFSFFIAVSSCTSTENTKIKPTVKKGVIDLRNWDFDRSGPAVLSGEWEFYWQKHVAPGYFSENNSHGEIFYMQFPMDWKGTTWKGKKLPEDGFATYRMKALLHKKNINLAFKFNKIDSAFTIFVNGKKVSSSGSPGKSRDSTVPRIHPHTADFFTDSHELDIVLHVSNFHTRKGEPENPILLGTGKQITEERSRNLVIEFFLFGSLIFMGLYHMGLFLLRRKYKVPLYFSIYCFLIALRTILMGERYLVSLMPGMSFEAMVKLEFLTMYVGLPVLFLFIHALYKEESNKIALYISMILGAVFSLVITVSPLDIVILTLPPYQLITLVTALFMIFIIIRATIHKKDGAIIFLVAGLIFFIAVVNDILHAQNIINTGYYMAFGLFVFFFAQAFLLSLRFSRAFSSVENLSQELSIKSSELERANVRLSDLNQTLELKVEERTRELRMAMNALWGEMELAKKIQTVLLPEKPNIEGYDISAYMVPADEVGGDYYDVLNVAGKDWIVIGDVSGHGVPAGLVMMMVQTSIQVVLSQNPEMHPSELLAVVNSTITRNIQKLNEDKYMTITVFACFENGTFYFSGLHQDIMIYRSNSNAVELVETSGFWIGIVEDIQHMVSDDKLTLHVNDTMLLYTDGITEAWKKGSIKNERNPEEEMFGDEKLAKIFQKSGNLETVEVKNSILKELEDYDCGDDVTMVIIKRLE